MIALPMVAGTVVTFTAVWFVWTARRAWPCGQRPPLRATVTVTVVRPIQSPAAIPERPAPAILTGRVIRGEIEPRHREEGST